MMPKGTTGTEYVKWCWSVQNSCCSLDCYGICLISHNDITKNETVLHESVWRYSHMILFTDWYILCCFSGKWSLQYIPRNIHTVFALLCFVVVIHWLIFPYPSGLLHWHCGNLTIAPAPAKQPWWIWINTSCELIMNDCITTTKQSTTKPCAYFLGYTVGRVFCKIQSLIIA